MQFLEYILVTCNYFIIDKKYVILNWSQKAGGIQSWGRDKFNAGELKVVNNYAKSILDILRGPYEI